MSPALRVVAFPPGDALHQPAFDAVRARVGYPTPDAPPAHDATCLVAMRGAEPVARCALHLGQEVRGIEGPCGMIGHYEALRDDAGSRLLSEATARLRARGAAGVLGPIDGSTWTRYRLALPRTEDDPPFDPPSFLSEPVNPDAYVRHFRAAGFRVAAGYESRLVPDPTEHAAGGSAAERVSAAGVRIREVRTADWDREMAALHALSQSAFAENPFYSPIDLGGFRTLYEPLRHRLDSRLALLAEDAGGGLVGTVFAFPDAFDAGEGRVPRIVLKTLAVHPSMRGIGLGAALTSRIHGIAASMGSPAVIHALMHVDNRSIRISAGSHSLLFRRYALFRHDAR
jgi:predicted N-acetyltransferase YhbS